MEVVHSHQFCRYARRCLQVGGEMVYVESVERIALPQGGRTWILR